MNETRSQDEEQIRQVMADRVAAMQEHDADRFVGHYAPGVVKFDLAPPLQYTGTEATDADGLRAWFADKGDGPIGYEIRELT
jgi:ketosteroid isomerase-like protein